MQQKSLIKRKREKPPLIVRIQQNPKKYKRKEQLPVGQLTNVEQQQLLDQIPGTSGINKAISANEDVPNNLKWNPEQDNLNLTKKSKPTLKTTAPRSGRK